ncbi:amidohydrolase/deacetylase family metallohydrolase [Lunatimonas salinarum]|uniref:amidohydrolase/deacetylase family metallohydrolase n=1 Tax=Lunatimonas salinarum TaxID=1774590 RepID=UPI001AE02BA2|nr:amidohydrolase/deacetylase family metallohydrolase [Lunatimonas salinarum]
MRWNLDFYIASILWLLCLAVPMGVKSQSYDLVIKNGHLYDAKNRINQPMDLAIKGGKIAKVAPKIPAGDGKKAIDATGLWISPGFIDPHTHVFVGENPRVFAGGSSSVFPDAFSFRSGVTTVVDAGTSGWRNFEDFKTSVIDVAQTRVLAFLNIAGGGMSGDPFQQDIQDMNPEMTFNMIQKYPDLMVGVKIGHYEGKSWQPFDLAIEAATLAKRPLLVECHLPEYSLEDQLKRMRPGDLLTHTYENIRDRSPVVDEQGNLRPEVLEAKHRGVLFDLSHGGAGFWFDQAVPAIQQGLTPDTFGTDLHRFSMNSGMKNFANVLSKFLALGMGLEEVLEKATWGTAKALLREDLGHLSEGTVADLTLIRIREGSFGFVDSGGVRITGNKLIEPELTIRAGRIVYDLNGLSASPFKFD